MRQYLLCVYQPDGEPPPPEVLAPVMADLGGFTVIQLLGGLTTAEIAHAFLVPEPTMAQRIVRAKGMRLGRVSTAEVGHTPAPFTGLQIDRSWSRRSPTTARVAAEADVGSSPIVR